MVFYKATGGATDWRSDANWGSTRPIGTWEGVTTNAAGRVSRLELEANRLTGAIPAELGQLTNLKSLYLSTNFLSGPIPAELGQLTNLKRLYICNSGLSGAIPAELGQLTNLKSLVLSGNDLTGAIPAELGQLTNLKSLYLSSSWYLSNSFSGCIPASLRTIPDNNLDKLGLSFCE